MNCAYNNIDYTSNDISAIKDCKNEEESYGEICVKCNKCGRFKETVRSNTE